MSFNHDQAVEVAAQLSKRYPFLVFTPRDIAGEHPYSFVGISVHVSCYITRCVATLDEENDFAHLQQAAKIICQADEDRIPFEEAEPQEVNPPSATNEDDGPGARQIEYQPYAGIHPEPHADFNSSFPVLEYHYTGGEYSG